MFLDKDNRQLFDGDTVKFVKHRHNPYVNEAIPSFTGKVEMNGKAMILRLPKKGFLLFEDDGEPCYELEKIS